MAITIDKPLIDRAALYFAARGNQEWARLPAVAQSNALQVAADELAIRYPRLRTDLTETETQVLEQALFRLARAILAKPLALVATAPITKTRSKLGEIEKETVYGEAVTDPFPDVTALLKPLLVPVRVANTSIWSGVLSGAIGQPGGGSAFGAGGGGCGGGVTSANSPSYSMYASLEHEVWSPASYDTQVGPGMDGQPLPARVAFDHRGNRGGAGGGGNADATSTARAGDGGPGGFPGGGGGGGGASTNGSARAGNGGKGGDGVVYVITWCSN